MHGSSILNNYDLRESLDEAEWPTVAIEMEQEANKVRKRALLASELIRLAYSGDRKALGDALLELNPTLKVPKFKVYGKNKVAKEIQEFLN